MKANSIEDFIACLRSSPCPKDLKERSEFNVFRSWAYSPIFPESFPDNGPFELSRGSDPPDFLIISGNVRTAIEVTVFTTGQYEVFCRERIEPGSFTSTLRYGNANRQFWNDLRNRTLPDDSNVRPHFEDIKDLDRDFKRIAERVLKDKITDLRSYRSEFSRCILLVHDRLSLFLSDINRRKPIVREVLENLTPTGKFDKVIFVYGSHYVSEVTQI